MIPKLLCLLTLLLSMDCLKILVVFPTASKSHVLLGEAYVSELNRAGHHVTFMTPYPKNKKTDLLTEVDISYMSQFWENPTVFNVTELIKTKASAYRRPESLSAVALATNKFFLQNDVIQQFLRDKKQEFDVILAEWFLGNILISLNQVFQCPIVLAIPTEINAEYVNMVEHLQSPAVSQANLMVENSLPYLTFMDRLDSLITSIRGQIQKQFVLEPEEKRLYETLIRPAAEARGVTDSLSYEEAVQDISLVLYNSHPSLGLALSLPPNVIPVGGFHIPRTTAPLPKDLQTLMDKSTHGVIFFSLGSILKSKDLTTEMKRDILEVFGKLKQTVLMKFEEDLPHKPDNVHIRNWFPQQSILAHPNLRLFISHGGLLSMNEAVHFGVPVLGIPIFGDQFQGVETAVRKSIAIKIDAQNLISDMEEAINKVLAENKYAKAAKLVSSYYHDRPRPPAEELLLWIEHAARTDGATYLRSVTRQVTIIEYLYLDLLAVFLVIILSIMFLVQKMYSKMKVVIRKQKNKIE